MSLRLIGRAAVTASLLLSASPAFALEGKALLDRLVEERSRNDSKVTWKSVVEDSSDSFTVMGLEITSKSNETVRIEAIKVGGLRETSDGLITLDSLTISEMGGDTRKKGTFRVEEIAASEASFPEGLFDKNLSDATRKQRVTFGNFTINGLDVRDSDAAMSLEALAMVDADIPLDFKYDKGIDAGETVPAPLTLATFALTKVAFTQDQVTSRLEGFNLQNLKVPTSIAVPVSDWMSLYSLINISKVDVAMGDTTLFSMADLNATLSPPDASGTYRGTSRMDGIRINLKAIPDPNAQQVIDQLGYAELDGSINADTRYNPGTGRVDLADFSMDFKEAFKLAMSYALTGYTEKVAQQLNALQMEMANSKDQSAALGSMMNVLGGVKLEDFSVSLTDRSLTGRLLDFQAKQMGTTGDQLAASAPLFIGLGLGQLQMPELSEMITKAATTFLKERGTITARVAPKEPVSISQIFAASQSDPKQLPELLNLQVSAQ